MRASRWTQGNARAIPNLRGQVFLCKTAAPLPPRQVVPLPRPSRQNAVLPTCTFSCHFNEDHGTLSLAEHPLPYTVVHFSQNPTRCTTVSMSKRETRSLWSLPFPRHTGLQGRPLPGGAGVPLS